MVDPVRAIYFQNKIAIAVGEICRMAKAEAFTEGIELVTQVEINTAFQNFEDAQPPSPSAPAIVDDQFLSACGIRQDDEEESK